MRGNRELEFTKSEPLLKIQYYEVDGQSVEYLQDGFADIKYFESSQRARINSKGNLSFNVGACQRISEPYGFNPLEEWMLPSGTLHYTQLALDEGYTVNFSDPEKAV